MKKQATKSGPGERTNIPATETLPPEIRPGQSLELLKELHILTRDGKLNQDSRRKLKQVYHLYQFIEPLLREVLDEKGQVRLVDHGAGKSYLGFILYDLFFKNHLAMPTTSAPADVAAKAPAVASHGQGEAASMHVYGIETRAELVQKSQELAQRLGFDGMSFLNLSVADSMADASLPVQIDVVTALHACNTATDDAIAFALKKQARFMVLVPCCQAEVASVLRKNKAASMKDPLSEIWRHPLHTREFGSQVTNVLRCLQLEAHGYQVNVTELVGWEHSMKNELIIATRKSGHNPRAAERLQQVLANLGLQEMQGRFFTPATSTHAAVTH